MDKRFVAILAATATETIYGVNHTIAKGLMPHVIQPFGFIVLRVGGAALLFWLLSLFTKSEKIDRKDWWRILACAVFGMVLNMLMFFKGLSLSTPINSAVSMTITPVLLLLLTALILRERITWIKTAGIIFGLSGALVLILFQEKTQNNAPNIPLGNLLFVLNAISYSFYLILVKPLVSKYKAVTLLKYFFLIAFFINLPVGYSEFIQVEWMQLTSSEIWQMVFVVVATSFLTYLFNIFALKQLSPSTVGVFIYLQPVVATIFAVLAGADSLNALRIGAASLIFVGVFLSTRKPKKAILPT
ncbi:putative permease, DMT superfamily [Aequorivita sublithincola DSM 14238]|uniref:Putative permease, DMT superfamily n=1 Tax=Aequorivita sublithincola (strain DSM 14238 / LMG 21431 / ACAM 643 / 9-3) TaxID=746697 RepID=I3YVM6_AEQSU|nr:DMT family transporter [Aequorivita sublithincola]AFL81044.1 putative permease, DMT superfamily [Aequorivita sublithincola DSM 14238]